MRVRSTRRIAQVGLLIVAGACAGGGALRLDEVTPQSIPDLEAQHQARPGDAAVLVRLGVAYFRAQRYPQARAALDTASARDPRNGLAAVYLGITAEEQGDFAAARSAYQQYLAVARSGELRNAARSRLALVSRRELEFTARQALAAEATLTQLPPEPNTVAVMPFGYTGTNEELRPLSRGFAQLVITDLAKSGQLRVLERERMQAILDEMRLGQAGQAGAEAAARSGRLLRAARVVQGSLADRGNDLRADAAVVDVATAGLSGAANASDALSRLFEIEKQLVFSIFESLGIPLTEAEREAINRRPTQNVQAFLAYSRGLEAADGGDFQAAAQFFNQAARLDPGFQAAQAGAVQAADLGTASQQSVSDMDASAARNERVESGASGQQAQSHAITNGLTAVAPASTAVATQQVQAPPPPAQKDTQAEASGSDRTGAVIGRILIVILRP